MRNVVYCFKPKHSGYNVFVTRTIHGNPKRTTQPRRSGGMSDLLINMAARGLVRGLMGRKR